MSFAVSLLVSVALATLFQKPLKKIPTVFYAIAVLMCLAAIYLTWNPSPYQWARLIVFAIQKGQVGFSLFILVMFIGVFSKRSTIRRYFTPIRAQLSILASIFIVSHFIPYLFNYLTLITSLFSYKTNISVGFITGIILLLLLIPLAITSFNVIRKKMNAGTWKALQRWSYVFIILAYIHAVCFLLVPATGNSDIAMITNIILYSVIMAAYGILRFRRKIIDKKEALPQNTVAN